MEIEFEGNAGETAIDHCVLCGERKTEILSREDRKGEPLLTVICVNCGLVRTDPIPTTEEIRKFYSFDYRQDYMHTYQPTPRLVHRAGMNALLRWRQLQGVLQPGQKILDLGSGGGEFVFVLRQHGYDAHGLEPNRGYGEYAIRELGLPIEIGFAEDIEIAEQSYDVITLYHILEHFRDPSAIVQRVHRWLRVGGKAIIEVPNVEAICQSPGHRFHRAHLYNFNPPTLEMLCHQAGFIVERTWLSEDGGNVTVQLRKTENVPSQSIALPDNCRRIRLALERHTRMRHYASHYPYLRPLLKLAQYTREFLDTRRADNGRLLLMQMVRSA